MEALFQGVVAGEIVEDGLASDVAVRLPPSLRSSPEKIAALPVSTPAGDLVRLGAVAEVRHALGPSLIRRENAQRVAMVTANVAGADLAGTVGRARAAVDDGVDLPSGYFVTFGGQFEEAGRRISTVALLVVLILVAMYGLLYIEFGSHRETLIMLVNVPLALVGGVLAVALGGGVLSLATVIGFVTLFGIATRNGVLLVSNYRRLLGGAAAGRSRSARLGPADGARADDGVDRRPRAGAPGAGCRRPGQRAPESDGAGHPRGLLTSTFLNLLVVPVLYVVAVATCGRCRCHCSCGSSEQRSRGSRDGGTTISRIGLDFASPGALPAVLALRQIRSAAFVVDDPVVRAGNFVVPKGARLQHLEDPVELNLRHESGGAGQAGQPHVARLRVVLRQ